MNYERIYAEFIRDRQLKQPKKPEYFESHHIKPRSLGGYDEPWNMIRLTPEDHYFAHLLLAKIHGGKLWLAVMAMARLTVGERDVNRLQQRGTYGIARRMASAWFSENMAGKNSPAADKAVHTLRHKDGREATGRRFELEAETGISKRKLSALLLGKSVTASGWFDASRATDWSSVQKLLRARRARDRNVLTLCRADGTQWSGLRNEFAEQFGRRLCFKSEIGHCGGWFRSARHIAKWTEKEAEKRQIAADARGDISGHKNPRADMRRYMFINLDTGAERNMTRVEMREASGASVSHIQRLVSGQLRRVGSWAMAGADSKKQRGAVYRFVRPDGTEVVGSKNAIHKKIGVSPYMVEKMILSGEARSGWKWDGAQPSY